MLSFDLRHLRDAAYRYLLEVDRSLPTHRIARTLFGPRRHEHPETQAVVRALLVGDPRFLETHEGRWSVRDAPHMRVPLDAAAFAVVDLETTGSLIGVDEVIEVGVVVVRRRHLVRQFSTLVHADRRIPAWVENLTGIHSADTKDAPTFSKVIPTLTDLLQDAVFVAHDIRFDLPFIRWEYANRDLPMPPVTGLCTLRLSRILWPDLASRSLPDLARYFDVTHKHPHRAAADATATAAILVEALQTAREIGLTELGDLFQLVEAADTEEAAANSPLRAEAAD
jgi:DNA polymerase III epsilon subunit family exonuclease